MGKRGPRPLPSAVKRARGTFQPCRNSPAEPHGEPGIPQCPAGLDAAERAEWNASGALLFGIGVLHAGHGDALLLLVKAKVRYVTLAAKVAELGEVLEDDRGNLYRNPYVISLEKAEAQYRRMCAEFGITPSAATRVRAEQAGSKTAAKPAVPAFGVLSGARKSS